MLRSKYALIFSSSEVALLSIINVSTSEVSKESEYVPSVYPDPALSIVIESIIPSTTTALALNPVPAPASDSATVGLAVYCSPPLVISMSCPLPPETVTVASAPAPGPGISVIPEGKSKTNSYICGEV